MARVQLQLPDGLEAAISTLEKRTTEILGKALAQGGEEAEEVVRRSLVAVLSNEHKDGELVNALGTSPARTDGNGVLNVKIGFREPRKKQGGSMTTRSGKRRSYSEATNAMIANVLEHGSSRIAARPFLKPSQNKAVKAAEETIIKIFDEEVGNA